jgi:hypothetical protein
MSQDLTVTAAELEQAARRLLGQADDTPADSVEVPAVAGHVYRAVHSLAWIVSRLVEVVDDRPGPQWDRAHIAANAAHDALLTAVDALEALHEAAEYAQDAAPTAA